MSATASVTVDGVPGVEIAYDRKGAGPPLLLLHGIGHHRQAWDPVIDQLAESRDVIAMDFPGFGESPDVPPASRTRWTASSARSRPSARPSTS